MKAFLIVINHFYVYTKTFMKKKIYKVQNISFNICYMDDLNCFSYIFKKIT